jgi:hypothetical protein
VIRHLKSKHRVNPDCKQKARVGNPLQPPHKRARVVTEFTESDKTKIDDLYTRTICHSAQLSYWALFYLFNNVSKIICPVNFQVLTIRHLSVS